MPLVALGLACAALPAEAKLFRNAYVSFELPPNWNCKLEGTEWVCESDFAQKAKEAIIILTAKEVGPVDTLTAYKAHLETPRLLPGPGGGAPEKSKVLHVKERQIANHPWVDGMHMGSEIGAYYTRYMATVKDKIAILVTFSAHKAHYTKYSGDFLKAIESLRVVATKDLLGDRPSLDPRRNNETIGAPIGQNIPSMEESMPMENSSGGGGKWLNIGLIILVLGAVGAVLYLRARKKKK